MTDLEPWQRDYLEASGGRPLPTYTLQGHRMQAPSDLVGLSREVRAVLIAVLLLVGVVALVVLS